MFKNFKIKYLLLFILILINVVFHLPNFASEIFDSDKNIIGKEYEIGTIINSDEKMKWVVIDYNKDNSNEVFLVTKDIVDFREYHSKSEKTNYKNSKIRYYLNKEFYEKNFSNEEKKHILLSEVIVSLDISSTVNEEEMTEQIKVKDKLFLLSVDEVTKYQSINKIVTRNSYAEKIVSGEYNYDYWTRDIESNYSQPKFINIDGVRSCDPYLYLGVIVGMWYDFSLEKTDAEFAEEEANNRIKFLLDRKGGKDKVVLYTEKEKNLAAKFDNRQITKFIYNIVPLGVYTYRKDLSSPISWYVVNDDGKELTLLSRNIIEYIEIEYDTYDKEELKDDPYSHSNLKKYINNDLFNNLFNDDEKQLIVDNDGEKMTIPNANDIFNYDLFSDWQDDMVLNSQNLYYYGNLGKLSYFINVSYMYDGMPYIMCLMQKDDVGRVSFNYSYDKNKTADIITCSGIRPIVKVDKKKLIEYLKNKSIEFDNKILQKSSSISKKIKFNQLVKFGKYEQDNNLLNGKEDIEWRVIREKEGKYLLLSDKILDVVDLSNDIEVNSFENSYAYNFANIIFFDEAFSESDKEKLELIKSQYTKFDKYRFTMTEELYKEASSSRDIKNCYNKIAFLSARFDADNIVLMCEEIFRPRNTDYVNKKIDNLDTYLVEDLAVYSGINYYFQMKNDGNIDYTKKTSTGFRPMICIDVENLVKIIEK